MGLTVAGMVFSTGAAVPVMAGEPNPTEASGKVVEPTDTDDDGTLDAPTTSTALATASAENKRVEDFSQRTEALSTFANPDGTFTQRNYGAPTRIKRQGRWVPVDYTLIKKADGTYAPKASPVDVIVSNGGGKNAARVDFDDDQSLAFTWPTILPKPEVNGNEATFKVSTSSDLLVTATESGVNARIRVNSRPATDDQVFRVGMRAEGVSVDQIPSGELSVTDETGEEVASTTQLSAWDAKTDQGGDPIDVVDLTADLSGGRKVGDATEHSLDLSTPDKFLTDPDTEYPVIIDPDISMEKTRDTCVRAGDTASRGGEDRLIVGKIDPNVSSNSYPARSYLKFYSGVIETNPNIVVNSATLGLYQYYAYTCNNRPMNIYPVTKAWSDNVTWAKRPDVIGGQGNTSVSANRGTSGCAAGWTTVNLTNMARAWARGGVDMQGIRLTADNEEIHSAERRFCSMNPSNSGACSSASRRPYLDVNYSVPQPANSVTLQGKIQNNGTAVAGASVRAQITPNDSYLESLAEGADLLRWEAGSSLTNPDGTFSLVLNRGALPSQYVGDNNQIDVVLDATKGSGIIRYYTTVGSNNTDAGPATKILIDFGTKAALDSANPTEYDGVPGASPESEHVGLEEIEPEYGDNDPPVTPEEEAQADETPLSPEPPSQSVADIVANPQIANAGAAVEPVTAVTTEDREKSSPYANVRVAAAIAQPGVAASAPGTGWCGDRKSTTYSVYERFQKVYGWDGARSVSQQKNETVHHLQVGFALANGPWKAQGMNKKTFHSSITRTETGIRHQFFNTVKYHKTLEECWVLGLDGTYSKVIRSQTVEPGKLAAFFSKRTKTPNVKWDHNCEWANAGGQLVRDSGKAKTEEGGVGLGFVSLDARSGYNEKTKVTFNFTKKSRICTSSASKDINDDGVALKIWSRAGYLNR